MAKEDQLFTLIKALTPNEKRYFVRYAFERKQKDNEYIKLFETINKLKEYDKTEILFLTKSLGFNKHLEVKKTYLYELILQSLKQYHNKELNHQNSLAYIDILISKNLVEQAQKLIKKKKKELFNQDLFMFEIQLLERELILAKKEKLKTVPSITNAIRQNIILYDNVLAYSNLFSQFQLFISRYSFVRNTKQNNLYLKIAKNPLITHEKEAFSYTSKLYFYYINYYFQASSGNWNMAYLNAKKMYALIIKKTSFANINPEMLIRATSAYMGSILLDQHPIAEFNSVVKKFKSIVNAIPNKYYNVLAMSRYYQFQLIAYTHQGKHKQACDFSKDVIVFINENEKNLDKEILKYVFFDIAKSHFRLNEFRIANKWFLKADFPSKSHLGSDIFAFSRILSLICSIMQGETELVVQNAFLLKRQLKQLGILYTFENFLISFITSKLIKWNDYNKENRLNLLTLFQTKLKKELHGKWKKNTVIYFNFETWLKEMILETAANSK